jgi:lipopolysaccharide export system protein LptA
LLAALLAVTGPFAAAQESGPFGGFKHDRTAPIEITSDALEVRQAEKLAIFTGDVVAGQGTLRLTADRLDVAYDQAAEGSTETGDIRNMQAHGNVFISNGTETAQGEQAEYDVDAGIITMTGSVVLTQGENVISGQRLVINVDEGQGRMEGRVKSIFTPQRDGEGTN